MVDRSLYKVGEVVSVESLGDKAGQKPLRLCKVNVGDASGEFLSVVTSATNVREGSRVAVAPVGSIVETETGEELVIKKTSVGGVMSEGMLCDSRMLGWQGGAAGIAAQIPDSVAIGASPPASKPRPNQSSEDAADTPSQPIEGLFEKKLSKEEKKKLAEAKRLAKRAAKDAKKEDD
ncbi:hypothetical protein MPSEU_000946600 [Mayamaea pseudoterrestris]|nr:hypothetical protein MPSEU_000946600 [Mayamaea pseudoterrestris]